MTQTHHPTQNASNFYGLGIAPKLLEALDKMKFTEPTPIQQKAIPVAIEGLDVIGIAQTGTGKTLAFAIPMIQRIARVQGRGLVILPTRELALQVEEVFQRVGRTFGLKTAILIGGAAPVDGSPQKPPCRHWHTRKNNRPPHPEKPSPE